jgi:hypothetical protein
MAIIPKYLTSTLQQSLQEAYNHLTNFVTSQQSIITQKIIDYNAEPILDTVSVYVDKVNGDDVDNSGSIDSPYRTITRAIFTNIRHRTIKIILKNDYLVSSIENFHSHPNVILDLNKHQLQFRRMILDTVANGGTMSQADVNKYGASVGMYHFSNISGLKVLCTGSCIVIPICYLVTPPTTTFVPYPELDDTFIPNFAYNNTAFQATGQKNRQPNDSGIIYFYADDSDPATSKIGGRIYIVDTSMQIALVDHPENRYSIVYGEKPNGMVVADATDRRYISTHGCLYKYMIHEYIGNNYIEDTVVEETNPNKEYIIDNTVDVYSFSNGIANIRDSTFPAIENLDSPEHPEQL